jgi:hypothetical protein
MHWLRRLQSDNSASVALLFSGSLLAVSLTVGAAVDFTVAQNAKAKLQSILDASVLGGLRSRGAEALAAENLFNAQNTIAGVEHSFALKGDTLEGSAHAHVPTTFMKLAGISSLRVEAAAKALRTMSGTPAGGSPCIIALAPSAKQALLVNSGAKIDAPDCEVHVRSTASPAAIFNAGTTLKLKRFCIQGTSIIKNTSNPLPIETGCAAAADPYVDALPKPVVGACTNTKSVYDPPSGGAPHVMPAGSVWCNLTFNGSPRVLFQPGLHIIKGRMIINSGAVVEGAGVTFFFPDTGSEIRFNGALTSRLSAPASGPYANILMFEPSPGTATSRVQYVFNSSVSEEISGLIYLPRRNLTWNSTSTVIGSKVQIVGNTIIFNTLNWRLSTPTLPGGGSPASDSVRLVQ